MAHPGSRKAELVAVVGDWVINTRTSTRSDGDFAVGGDPAALAARRAALVDLPWVWLHQVHGAEVVVATAADLAQAAGSEADAVVTAEPGLALAIHTADCLPVVMWSPEGVIGAAHAGWRGLESGVIERTAEAMRRLGASRVEARTGPCIRVECYEFGGADLDRLADRFGAEVRGTTRGASAALDLVKAFQAVAREHLDGWGGSGGCTACDAAQRFSHRARGDAGRMATVVWREPARFEPSPAER